jgi:phage shock protein A
MHTEFKKVCKDRRQLEKAVEEKDALLDKQRDALASLTAQVAAKEGEIEGLRAELAAIESHPIDRHDQYESILLSLKEETAKGDTERLAKLATSHLKDAIIDASKTHQAWVMRTNQMKRWKEKAGKAIDQNEEDRQHLSRFGAIIEKMGNELSLAQTELETKGAELLAIARRITDLEGSTATRKEMLETIGYHQANAHKFAQQLAERNQQWVKLASLLGCDVESVESELTSVKTELARAKEQATERWLPIETAPESEYVLVFLPNYGHATATRTGRDWWAVNRGERINPTHWQPLPEPPMPIEATAAATNEGKGEGDNEQR